MLREVLHRSGIVVASAPSLGLCLHPFDVFGVELPVVEVVDEGEDRAGETMSEGDELPLFVLGLRPRPSVRQVDNAPADLVPDGLAQNLWPLGT